MIAVLAILALILGVVAVIRVGLRLLAYFGGLFIVAMLFYGAFVA